MLVPSEEVKTTGAEGIGVGVVACVVEAGKMLEVIDDALAISQGPYEI